MRRFTALASGAALVAATSAAPAAPHEGSDSHSYSAAAAAAAQPAKKPSVLVMIADDLRPSFGSFGQSFAATPHVDALAASGMLFQRAYCQVSVCAPR